MLRPLLIAAVLAVLAGCSTYRDDLNRGQRLYEDSEYDRALAVWRYLEYDIDSLSPEEQARYAYLRGMTDYRLGGGKGGTDAPFRAHARHWLAIAKAIEMEHPGALSAAWQELLTEALTELNAEIYGIPAAPAASSGVPAVSAAAAATAPPTVSAAAAATAPPTATASTVAPGAPVAAPAVTVPAAPTAEGSARPASSSVPPSP